MIEIRNLTKSYGRMPALRNLNLTVDRGEMVTLLGPNGAGKSTLLQCILGILPFEGQVLVDGMDPRRDGKRVRAITGYMPQASGLHPDLTVAETLWFYSELRSVGPANAAALLREVRLEDYENANVGELSGGLRQRLAFAVACMSEPKILLLDEPSASVDKESRGLMYAGLRKRTAAGATILLSTHFTQDLGGVSDRFVVLEQGRISCAHTSVAGVA